LRTIEADYDLSPNVDHRHAHLTGTAHHVTRGGLVTADINIREFDALLAEIALCQIAERAGWRAKHDHFRLIFLICHLDTSKILIY
jgi:hypothetical protein